MADCEQCRAQPLIEDNRRSNAMSPGVGRAAHPSPSEDTMAGSSSSTSDEESGSSDLSRSNPCPLGCGDSHLREEDIARLDREGTYPGCCTLLLFYCRNQFRTDKGRLPRRLWLTLVFGTMVVVEAHQHISCHLSWDDDVDGGDKLPRQCQTVMRLHDYTELLCKAGLAVVCVRVLLGFIFDGCPRPTKAEACKWAIEAAPSVAYLIWPGAFWVIFGDEGGLCGDSCQAMEAIMEHGCCFVVLMALAATLWDFIATVCLGKPGAVCMFCTNTCLCRHGIEDHIAPSHSWEDCSDPGSDPEARGSASPSSLRSMRPKQADRAETILSWTAFLITTAIYAAQTWGGWGGTPTVGVLFRTFDTMCHAGICALVVAVIVNWHTQLRERLKQEWLQSIRADCLL
mmetsp:Transcript_53190/g.116484  ORF Transcript_53190/g.116484 Transcript_53190/m.116484 type:complete len:399 (+) Transcript_53190:345-1541(+)